MKHHESRRVYAVVLRVTSILAAVLIILCFSRHLVFLSSRGDEAALFLRWTEKPSGMEVPASPTGKALLFSVSLLPVIPIVLYVVLFIFFLRRRDRDYLIMAGLQVLVLLWALFGFH